jgi:hypothetical protein
MGIVKGNITETGRDCTGPCEEFKDWKEFHVGTKRGTGHVSMCRTCTAELAKKSSKTINKKAAILDPDMVNSFLSRKPISK